MSKSRNVEEELMKKEREGRISEPQVVSERTEGVTKQELKKVHGRIL